MSIIDKMKKAHPAYWVLGLGGAALAIDYYVERDRSVASSIYRKFFGGGGRGEGGGGRGTLHGRAAPVMPGSAIMPGPLYQTSRVYYPAYPPVHPYHHWMHRGLPFGHGRGFEHGGLGGYGHYGAFGRNRFR